MRVLHLISNHKFTGPVDPALGLIEAQRRLGIEAEFAIGRAATGPGPLDQVVADRGLHPLTGFTLPKHRRFLANRRDVRHLVRLLGETPFDVIHTHLDNAHETAQRACRFVHSLAGSRGDLKVPLLVRSLYDGAAPADTGRFRRLYGTSLGGLCVFGQRIASLCRERFRLPQERVLKLDGAVSSERFQPRTPAPALRARLGLPEGAIVVGIVARIQRHRRYEILLEAVRRAMEKVPNLTLLVLGRGTYARELAHERAADLGIAGRVCLPGYVGGAEYPEALACFDFKVFLVPGSDGTCRAVREAMATGVPLVVSQRGLLPEMVRDGEDGLVVDDEVEPLAAAIQRMAEDSELRARLGGNALRRARESFSAEKQARATLDAYQRWQDLGERVIR